MQASSPDNVLLLKRFLEDQGFCVQETHNGMRIQLDDEHVIDVNALIRDSDFFWASVETPKLAPEQLQQKIQGIGQKLAKALEGLARLGKFEETQDAEDHFVFVADIELLPDIIYHGKAEMAKPASPPLQTPKPQPPPDSQPSPRHTAPPPVCPAELMTAEKAVVLLETVDGKMLRQSLDMMNLRRSSNIRLALTRIFRSATDAEALISAITEEAAKLTSREDLQELEMIRVISATGFLHPMVELLCQEVFKEK